MSLLRRITTTLMKPIIKKAILNATSKALATYGTTGVHVVPVSMVRVDQDQIWLFNFFMSQTVANIIEQPQVALACWNGLTGVQIKATVEYETEGKRFNDATAWVARENPDRTVRGVLILSPTHYFDVSASKERAGKPL